MAYNFPSSPTNGQKSNGYYYDSATGAWLSEKRIGVPTGVTMAFAGATAPEGFLICDGSSKLRADYPALFEVLGGASSPYGLPSVTTFNVPDLQTRIPVGKNTTGTFATLGSTGGAESVVLTGAQSGLPVHNHGITDPGHNHTQNPHNHTQSAHDHGIPNVNSPTSGGGATLESWGGGSGSRSVRTDGQTPAIQNQTATNIATTTGISTINTTATNASEGHNNLQPYLTMNYIIKY
jgi:microcystin-dependent protein